MYDYEKYLIRKEQCAMAFVYYTEYHMSYRQVAQNLCVSFSTVKNLLEELQYFDDEKYVLYQKEKDKRKGGRPKK